MTTTTTITCLCGTIAVPSALLVQSSCPINIHCHCSTCRHTSGALGITCPLLHSAPPANLLAKLTAYHSSSWVTRYFCASCGSHVFYQDHQYDESVWYCLSGNIEPGAGDADGAWKDAIKILRHDFVADTVDGGLAPALLKVGGRDIPARGAEGMGTNRDLDMSSSAVLEMPKNAMTESSKLDQDSLLPAKCHCGGVSLLIKRANFSALDKARYIPRDRTKYKAYMCACRSCRLSIGVPLVPWATFPISQVFNASQTPLTPLIMSEDVLQAESNPGLSLKYHWSSTNVCRSFCGCCGASVSYWTSKLPNEIDLLVGIFRAEEGSMARKWLDWGWGRCDFEDEVTDEHMLAAWKEGQGVMSI